MPRAKNPNIVSTKSAIAALATLVQYGRQSFKQEYQSEQGRGVCVGLALSKLEFSPTQALDAAAALLEDENCHSLAAALRKLRDGNYHTDMYKTITIRADD